MGLEKKAQTAIAHARQLPDGTWVDPHDLADHLRGVAALAQASVQDWGGRDWAQLAGLWHDLGKYAADFQEYIRKASGFEREQAHVETPQRVDHSAAGGVHAMQLLGKPGIVLANLILAHHAGLYDAVELDQRLKGEKSAARYKAALAEAVPESVLAAPATPPALTVPGGVHTPGAYALWLRMLFSCLVDADFLDTEIYMDGGKATTRVGYAPLADLKPLFDAHMAGFVADSPVRVVRARVLEECRQAATQPPGLFTLTVPTGGGKTLSSMAFALEHAKRHGQRRIIYVIPYTSIIEQTADVFREIFGDNVVEHHSNAESDKEDARSRLACENWDAPIIVTTNVQFFESLFAARTSRCRKLHSIANSVVILDEAQLLPPDFLQPILDVLSLLFRYYKVSLVLCTATQPMLTTQRYFHGSLRGFGSDEARELAPVSVEIDERGPQSLATALKRVRLNLPRNLNRRNTWAEIAEEMGAHDRVLTIVNRRADARSLHKLLPKGTMHLSGLMCGQHRSEKIEDIKLAIARKEGVRVVSTQLIEAGVDIDFPMVFRALAGMDSIAQAAGRCNREGTLALGEVKVFVPPTEAPSGLLREAEGACVSLLGALIREGVVTEDLLEHPDVFERYFALYFQRHKQQGKGFDKNRVCDRLDVAIYDEEGDGFCNLDFRTAAKEFRLIDEEETGYKTLFVPYAGRKKPGQFQSLLGTIRATRRASRETMRALQRYAISLPERQFNTLQRDMDEPFPGLNVLTTDLLYDSEVGLKLDGILLPSVV